RDGNALTLGVFLNGSEIPTHSAQGAPVIDDTFLILFNAWEGAIVFTLPAVSFGRRWTHELSTAEPELEPGSEAYPARGVVPLERRSPLVLPRARWTGAGACPVASRRRQTSTTCGSNCVPAASSSRRSASSAGSA